jgi:hypothetical protein
VKLHSRPPLWSYFAIFAGVVLFVLLAALLQKTAVSDVWPFCDKCAQVSRRRRLIGFTLLAIGLSTVAALILVESLSFGSRFLGSGAALLMALLGTVVAVGSWRAASGAVVSEDGGWVTVSKAHPEFAQQVNAHAAAVEAQYGSAQAAVG